MGYARGMGWVAAGVLGVLGATGCGWLERTRSTGHPDVDDPDRARVAVPVRREATPPPVFEVVAPSPFPQLAIPVPEFDPGVLQTAPQRFVFPPLQETVEAYRVTMAPDLLASFYADEEAPMQPAEFTAPDGSRHQVMMRLRGNSSRSWPKKSWRIEFPPATLWDGRRNLNLVSSWREQTLMLEKLGFDALAAMGVPASRARYIRLYINGQFQGIYLDLERVDKHFLRNHGFADPDASIWRCGRKNCEMKPFFDPTYQQNWEKETNELAPSPELDAFMRVINFTPEPQFVEALSRQFSLENHLRNFAVDALISNATVEDSRAYVIYDAVRRRWTYAPWDLNNTDAKWTVGGAGTADFKHPLLNFSLLDGRVNDEYLNRAGGEPERWKPIFSNLNTRIVMNPKLRSRIVELTEQALDELFDPEVINARIEETYALLAPHHPGSPHDPPEQFADMRRYMKEYVANRTAFLRGEIEKWKNWSPTLVLQTVDPQQGYVELKNLGTSPVNTTGMVITTNLREGMAPLTAPTAVTRSAQHLPVLTLAPGETIRVNLTLPPEGEVGIFNGQSVVGVLDALYFGALPAGQRYVRSEADPLEWQVR
ncbi:MAG: CotH kinase family protein [Myxococcaceae bacterium]